MEVEYKNKKGKVITNLDSWKDAFIEVDSPKHWKEGRSAYSLAKYICEENGESRILSLLADTGVQSPKLVEAEIEHESIFDKCGGRGRMQDLHMIYDSAQGKIVVEIEAKVDETFGPCVSEAYSSAVQYLKEHPTSKRAKRITDLVKRIYKVDSLDIVKDLRYQLLYYLAGTCSEAKRDGATIAYMPVIVFKTNIYNAVVGEWNKQDYQTFVERIGFTKELINGRTVYSIDFEGVKIISTYEEVPLM